MEVQSDYKGFNQNASRKSLAYTKINLPSFCQALYSGSHSIVQLLVILRSAYNLLVFTHMCKWVDIHAHLDTVATNPISKAEIYMPVSPLR